MRWTKLNTPIAIIRDIHSRVFYIINYCSAVDYKLSVTQNKELYKLYAVE